MASKTKERLEERKEEALGKGSRRDTHDTPLLLDLSDAAVKSSSAPPRSAATSPP